MSGHSTFSRAAAEILTTLTGDAFFPGGMAEFTAKQNDFLVFEQGPSVDVTLQWATYRDASDQTSLSRIWGGIHLPVNDIPGRRMGIEVAERVWALSQYYFSGSAGNSELALDDTVAPGSIDNGNTGGGGNSGDNDGGSGCSIVSPGSGASGTQPSREPDPLLLALVVLAAMGVRREKSPVNDALERSLGLNHPATLLDQVRSMLTESTGGNPSDYVHDAALEKLRATHSH